MTDKYSIPNRTNGIGDPNNKAQIEATTMHFRNIEDSK